MATGGDTIFSSCSLCLDDGRNIVAKHYCVDCEVYFCTKCVKCHNIIPSLRKHQINDVNSSDSVNVDDDTKEREGESVKSLRCTLHQDKLIDTYCNEHDEVCCGACAVLKHRSCKTGSIATAAKVYRSSPEMDKCKEALNGDLINFKQEKEKRTVNLDCLGKQKQDSIENVDKYEEKIIARVKELANISRKEIRSKYEEHKTALETDIEALDVGIATHTDYIDKLDQIDDEQLFVYVKTNKTIAKDGAMLIQAMTTDWTKRELKFEFDEKLEDRVIEMKSFGRLEDECAVKMYQAVFERNVNVKQINDTYAVHVFDMCLIDSSDLLMTYHSNSKLKRFTSDFRFKDEILLSGQPIAVCKTDKHEVAMRIWETKVVHIVSVGQSMHITSSFTLADNGFGMTYDSDTGEILACEENKVSVYSKTGHKLRTYDKDTNGEQMFSACRQIALGMNKQDIYLTDHYKGLIVLDKGGYLKMKFSLPGVNDAMPLCLLPGHICLAGSELSGVIVQIDKDGNEIGNLIGTKDGLTYTYCAVYNREQSRLIVGGYPSVISVYTLSAK